MTDADWRGGTTRDDVLNMWHFARTVLDDRRSRLFGVAVMRRIWDLLTDPRFRDLVDAVEGWATGVTGEAEYTAARWRLPQISNWRPPAPSPLLWEPQQPRAGYLGGPAPDIPPPGVVNFRELPAWVRNTHHATVNLAGFDLRAVLLYAADARADHTAEQSPALKPFDDRIVAINREVDALQRGYDDAVWRGMSGAEQKGAALARRWQQAEGEARGWRGEQQAVREQIADATRTVEFAAQADLLRCVAGNPFAPITVSPHWRNETVLTLARGIVADRAFDRLPILADALEEAGCDHPDVLTHCRHPGPHARGCRVIAGLIS